MKKENLVKRLGKGLGKKVLPYFMAGALAFLNYGCGDVNEFVESKPEKPEEPVVMLAPVAMLTANPTEGDAPLEVSFDGSESYALEGDLEKYLWDFDGDGNIDATTLGALINDIYENAGEYNASLIVVDSNGQESDKALEKIVVKFVESKKPIAMLTANPTEGDAPLEVSFDGSESYALEGDLEKYLWDFDGDGNIDATTLGALINDIYENAGEYNASLIVVDSNGQESDKALEKIVVNEEIAPLDQIAFARWDVITEDNWDQHIYVGDLIKTAAGDTLVNLNRLTQSTQDLEPAWSPDGEKIAFTSNRDGNIRLYIMNADGTEQTILTPNMEHASDSSWSPDGTKIAFSYMDSGFSGIALIDPGYGGLEYLVEEPYAGYFVGRPRWSPDGNWITFYTNRDGNMEIYKVEVNNKENQINLTNSPAYDVSPSWSPDGSRIAFVSDPNPNDEFYEAEIYLINPDGGSKIQLTNNSAKDLDPDWSPDGLKLVFARRESPATTQDIWIMNADGTNERKVLESENHDRFPAWKPKKED